MERLIVGCLILALGAGCEPPCRVADVVFAPGEQLIYLQSEFSSLKFSAYLGECEPGKVPTPKVRQRLPSGQVFQSVPEVDQRAELAAGALPFGRFASVDVTLRMHEVGMHQLELDFAGERRQYSFEVITATRAAVGRQVPGHCYGPLRELDDDLVCNGYYPLEQRWSLTHFSMAGRTPEVLFELGDGARLWDTPDGLYASFDGGVGRVPRMLADWRPEFPLPEPIPFRARFTKLDSRLYFGTDDELCVSYIGGQPSSSCVSLTLDGGVLNEILPQSDAVIVSTVQFTPWVLHLDRYDVLDGGLTLSQSWEFPRRAVARVDLFSMWTSDVFDEKGLVRYVFDGGALEVVPSGVPSGVEVAGSSGDYVVTAIRTNARIWRCPIVFSGRGDFVGYSSIYSDPWVEYRAAGCTDRSLIVFSGAGTQFVPPTTTLHPLER